jgi:hypothetical protein
MPLLRREEHSVLMMQCSAWPPYHLLIGGTTWPPRRQRDGVALPPRKHAAGGSPQAGCETTPARETFGLVKGDGLYAGRRRERRRHPELIDGEVGAGSRGQRRGVRAGHQRPLRSRSRCAGPAARARAGEVHLAARPAAAGHILSALAGVPSCGLTPQGVAADPAAGLATASLSIR